jgi:hypothetical protein
MISLFTTKDTYFIANWQSLNRKIKNMKKKIEQSEGLRTSTSNGLVGFREIERNKIDAGEVGVLRFEI